MPLFHLVVLAVVQGVTEFLPVSSSGHLILLPKLIGAVDQGLALDVAVHVGTLLAVLLYFRSDTARIARGIGQLLRGDVDRPEARLALLLAIATAPVILAGFVFQVTGLEDALRSVEVIGWTMLIFGIVLYWADQRGAMEKTAADWNLRDAVVMGLFQALALVPGTSRSGITITASRLLGYDRSEGARIAMLMSIPTILASGVLLGAEVIGSANWALARDAAIGAALAFAAAYATLAVMMRLLTRVSFTPYVIYRVILGLALLGIAYR